MTDDKIIDLLLDTAQADAAGLPKPLKPDGSITFQTDAQGNRINLKGYKIVDGVAIDGPDDPEPKTSDIYPPAHDA